MTRTVFLAGATGAIGRRLGPMLLAAGWRVVGTTRVPARAAQLAAIGVEPVVVDVYDAAALLRAVAATAPEIVMHQLTDLPAGLDPARMAAAGLANARLREAGTRNLVAAAIAGGVASLEQQVLAAPLAGLVLRYGRLYGPGTGVDTPPAAAPLHVDAAAHAAVLAAEHGAPGVYNLAEDDGTVLSEHAKAEFGWSAAWRWPQPGA